MRISSDKKKDLLLQSFDVLKNDLEKNSDKIKELIAKMAQIDLSIAVEMWTYVLENGKRLVRDSSEAYSFCGGVIYELEEKIGKKAVIEILKENQNIIQAVFGESGDICVSTIFTIADCIKEGELELADKMISLVYKNKKKEKSFGEIFEEICEYSIDDELDEDLKAGTVDLLMNWSEKIIDKERKARITVTLLDYL